MANIKVNNLIRFYTLMLLSTGPKHGYEVIKNLESHLERKVSASQIYPFLELLKKNGYVEEKKSGAREKKVYSLTASGRSFVKGLLSRFGGLIDIAVEPKLNVCICGCEIYKGGYESVVNGKKRLFCCRHCADSFKRE